MKKKILKLNENLNRTTKILVESEQLLDEFIYQHEVGLYEYYLILRLYNTLKKTKNKFFSNLRLQLCIIYLLIYIRRVNISFLVMSLMLPVVFYYFFVLVDYYEAIEEFLEFVTLNYNYEYSFFK